MSDKSPKRPMTLKLELDDFQALEFAAATEGMTPGHFLMTTIIRPFLATLPRSPISRLRDDDQKPAA